MIVKSQQEGRGRGGGWFSPQYLSAITGPPMGPLTWSGSRSSGGGDGLSATTGPRTRKSRLLWSTRSSLSAMNGPGGIRGEPRFVGGVMMMLPPDVD